MIRISRTQSQSSSDFRVEGRAVGAFGEELVRVLDEALRRASPVRLDLEALLGIDQPTLEYLARFREHLVISRAPKYLDQWLEGLRRPEGNGSPAPLAEGRLDARGILGSL